MIAFVVAMVAIAALLLFMWIAISREPGPGPGDVALAYERAWNDLDFELLFELSGEEMRDGMRKPRYIATKRAAYADRDKHRHADARVTVDTMVAGNQTALVVTSVDVDGSTVHNNVMLEKRVNGWVVVSYSLRPDDAPTTSTPGS